MKKLSSFKFNPIRVSKHLTFAFLFSFSLFSKAGILYDFNYNVPNTTTFFGVQITSEGTDRIYHTNNNGGSWQQVATGNILQIFSSKNIRVNNGDLNNLKSRVMHQMYDADSYFVEVATEDKFVIGLHEKGIITFEKPPGLVKTRYWNPGLQSESGEKYTILSLTTDQGSQVSIARHSDGKSVVLGGYQVNVNDIKISKNTLSGLPSGPKDLDSVFSSPETSKPIPAAQNTTISTSNQKTNPSNSIKSSEVTVIDSEGKTVNAWKIIEPFVTDLIENNQNLSDADPTTRERIDRIFESLLKKEIGSAKILGPPGSGKTYLIKKMINVLLSEQAPRALKNTAFLQINPAAFSAGTKYVGTVETKLNAMIELSKKHKIVWVVDEAHVLSAVGTNANNSNNIFQILKPGLTDGYIRFIAMSTEEEWNSAYAGDTSTNERFEEVKVIEPTGEDLRTALKGFLKKHSFPDLDQGNLDLVIRLSSEFNAVGAQPRKGTRLIESIFARQQLTGDIHPPSTEEVKNAAQRLYNLHPDHFDRIKMLARLHQMPQVLSQHVIGQTAAKDALVDSFEMSLAGVEDKNKPKGRKIFAGPRGQGKTEIIKAVGLAMGTPVSRIVMTTYTHPGQTVELKQTIAQALRKNANGILFFDEIEKAHPSVQKDLLDVLDNGRFSVQEQIMGSHPVTLELNVRNAYVYMATNAGAGYIDSLKNQSEYNQKDMREAMHNDGLNDLVLDRMDGVIPFFYLDVHEYRKVVIAQIRNILKEYKLNNPEIELKLQNLRGFIDQTVKETFREKMSNREALVALSADLRVKIARAANRNGDSTKLNIKLNGQRTLDFRKNNKAPNSCPGVFLQQ